MNQNQQRFYQAGLVFEAQLFTLFSQWWPKRILTPTEREMQGLELLKDQTQLTLKNVLERKHEKL